MPVRAAVLIVGAAFSVLAPAQDGGVVALETRPTSAWSTLEVPVGSFVDLTRGVVTQTAPDGDAPFFRGPGEAFQGNVELFPFLRDDPVGPSRMIGRAAATAGSGTPYLKGLAEGDEALWVHGERWGYVRLLEFAATRARIEVATPLPGVELLVREPAVVRVEAEPSGYLLSFDGGSADPGAAVGPWLVERRVVGDPAPFEPLATIATTQFRDETAPRGRPLEWRVSRAGPTERFGATARALWVEHPGEWPLRLAVGQRLDLLTGALDVATAHVEVTQVSPPTVVLRPLGATLLNTSARPGSWTLPERMSFDPSFEGRLRAFALGNELHALTPEGVIVRMDVVGLEDGALALARQVALNGEHALPRAPEVTSIKLEGDSLDVRAAPLAADVERPEHVALVVERELAPDRNDWAWCAEGPPGARSLEVPLQLVFGDVRGAGAGGDAAEAVPLVRVRVRQRYAFGARSFPSEPRTVLRLDPADGATRERLADEAIAALDAPEWERRDGAQRLLEALGPAVFPRLEALLAAGTPEAQRAARSILMGAGAEGGRELLLAAEGRLAGLTTAPPTGLLAKGPAERAYALVSALEAAERRVDLSLVTEAFGWAAIVARFDDDAGVRGFSDMLVALHERGLLGGGGEALRGDLAALVPSAERLAGGGARPSALRSGSTLPLEAHVLLRELERHPWLAEREVGPVLGGMIAHLRRATRSAAWPPAVPDYDVESVDLTLRLVERYARLGDVRLLDAARGLFVVGRALDWELALEGWRSATAQRLADERAPSFVRERIVLSSADGAAPGIEELEAELIVLRQSGQQYVDLVLPPGDYGKPEGGHWIDLDIPGLRLVAAEHGSRPIEGDASAPAPVRITCGLRVMGARDVVLDGLRLEHRAGAALMALDGAHVVVRDCVVLGMGMGIQAQDADLELYGSHVGDLAHDRPGQWSARHLGRGRIVARGTLFTGGSVYVGDFGEPYFERCVFDAGERPVLQAQREGRPIARECFMRSTAMGLVNVSGGCLAAVVLDVPRDPFGPRPDGLSIDPRWFALIGAGQAVPSELLLERSPLEGQ